MLSAENKTEYLKKIHSFLIVIFLKIPYNKIGRFLPCIIKWRTTNG